MFKTTYVENRKGKLMFNTQKDKTHKDVAEDLTITDLIELMEYLNQKNKIYEISKNDNGDSNTHNDILE